MGACEDAARSYDNEVCKQLCGYRLHLQAMNISDILAAIDQEVSRLEQARSLLQSSNGPSVPAAVEGKRRGRPPGKATKAPVTTEAPVKQTRTMSEDGRARIAAAQKARWAAKKKADTKAAKVSASAPVAQKTTAAAKQAPVKKAAAAVKTAAAKKTAVPAKAAASKHAAVAATPTTAEKVAAKKPAQAAKKATPAKAAPKKRAAETSSKSASEATAGKPSAESATTAAEAAEATPGE